MKQDHDDTFWLEALEANLQDDDYRVYTDSETDFKLSALRKMMSRNKELENFANTCRDHLKDIKNVLDSDIILNDGKGKD